MKYFRLYFIAFMLICGINVSFGQILQPLTWNVRFESDGAEGTIIIDAQIERGWHLYATQLPEGGPIPTSITWDESRLRNVEIIGDLHPNRPAEENFDMFFHLMLGCWEGTVSFQQKIKLLNLDDYNLEGAIVGQVCNDQTCQRNKKEFKFSHIAEKKETVDTVPATVATIKPATPFPSAKLEKTDFWKPVVANNSATADHSLLYIFIGGFLGGLLALLTPCVWPMIPLTVSFFLKKNNNRKKAISQAAVYGLSIVVIYLLLGLLITIAFGPSKLNEMSTNAIFNIFFFLLLVFFAISFFGAFEITLPSKWTNAIDSKAGKTTGLISIFFMAFTLALVSFSCTGPIIGTLLVEAVTLGNLTGPAVGMAGFALALAIPFAFFAVFPSWLKGLPKSGGWLNTVKVVLGFIELALSLKFLSVADLAYGWRILDREVFISLWIIIFALLGLYLLKIIRFEGDSKKESIGAFRLILAIISLSFAAYLLPGLWGAPLKSVSAFTPPLSTQDFSLYESGKFVKYDNFDEGMNAAKEMGKPVFLDFSGYGCVNCRKMEASVFENEKIRQLIEDNFVMITLMTDDKKELPEIIELNENGENVKLRTYGDLWSYLQQYKFKANSQPYYVVLDNDGNLLSGPVYYDEDINKFAKFLNVGLKNYADK